MLIQLLQLAGIFIAMAAFLHVTDKDKCKTCDGVALLTANEGKIFGFMGVTKIRFNAKYSDF